MPRNVRVPQIVALAHDQIGSRVERRAHFAEPAVAAAALEAIFMPVDVQRLFLFSCFYFIFIRR